MTTEKLTFENSNQIAFVRKMEKIVEFHDLPSCTKCEGKGRLVDGCECFYCPGHACSSCGGIGKDQKSYDNFVEKHGPFKLWGELKAYKKTIE